MPGGPRTGAAKVLAAAFAVFLVVGVLGFAAHVTVTSSGQVQDAEPITYSSLVVYPSPVSQSSQVVSWVPVVYSTPIVMVVLRDSTTTYQVSGVETHDSTSSSVITLTSTQYSTSTVPLTPGWNDSLIEIWGPICVTPLWGGGSGLPIEQGDYVGVTWSATTPVYVFAFNQAQFYGFYSLLSTPPNMAYSYGQNGSLLFSTPASDQYYFTFCGTNWYSALNSASATVYNPAGTPVYVTTTRSTVIASTTSYTSTVTTRVSVPVDSTSSMVQTSESAVTSATEIYSQTMLTSTTTLTGTTTVTGTATNICNLSFWDWLFGIRSACKV